MVIGGPLRRSSDTSLVQVSHEAFSVRDKILSGTTETLNRMTLSITKSKGHLTSLMRLTYLAPGIIDDILGGRQLPERSPIRLLRTPRICRSIAAAEAQTARPESRQ
jgi:hypothetical protein